MAVYYSLPEGEGGMVAGGGTCGVGVGGWDGGHSFGCGSKLCDLANTVI